MSNSGAFSSASPPRGRILVVSSPSGAGKTTLCHKLLAEFPKVMFSVSYTTRPKRPNERDGVDYFFVSGEVFSRMVDEHSFVESAEVHGHRYGTASAPIDEALAGGRDVLLDIDWQGTNTLMADSRYRNDTTRVFVLPPSLEELARRLAARGTDDPVTVERRLKKAREEIDHYPEYDYLIINDDIRSAYDELRAVYVSDRCARERRVGFAEALRQQASG